MEVEHLSKHHLSYRLCTIDKTDSTFQTFQSSILDIISRDSMASSRRKTPFLVPHPFHDSALAPLTDPQSFATEPTDTIADPTRAHQCLHTPSSLILKAIIYFTKPSSVTHSSSEILGKSPGGGQERREASKTLSLFT